MASRKVTAPDRTVWVIRRRWISWRPQWRVRGKRLLAVVDFLDILDLGAIAFALGVVAAVLLLVFVVLPGLIFLVRIAFRQSCSELNTRAGPVNLGCLIPDVFATHPSVDKFPFRIER